MDQRPVNRWQEVLYGLCIGAAAFVNPKALAHRLHRAQDYISDICRRERVDPMAVFNQILRDAEAYARTDVRRFAKVSRAIFPLLLDGTNWQVQHYDPASVVENDLHKLCEQAGVLMQDLGTAIVSLSTIERDGDYDRDDDPDIAEFQLKADQLVTRIRAIQLELCRRRNQGVAR